MLATMRSALVKYGEVWLLAGLERIAALTKLCFVAFTLALKSAFISIASVFRVASVAILPSKSSIVLATDGSGGAFLQLLLTRLQFDFSLGSRSPVNFRKRAETYQLSSLIGAFVAFCWRT